MAALPYDTFQPEQVQSIASPSFRGTAPEIRNPDLLPYFSRHAMDESWSRGTFPASEIAVYRATDVFVAHEGMVFDRNLRIAANTTYQSSTEEIVRTRDGIRQALELGRVGSRAGLSVVAKKRAPNNYGHYLIEMFPRSVLGEQIFGGAKPGFIVHEVSPAMGHVVYQAHRTIGVGLDRLYVQPNAAVHYEEVIMFDGLSRHGTFMSPVAVDAVASLAADVPAAGAERIFVGRRSADRRGIENEAALTAALEKSGFVTVFPGELTLFEQIAVFRSARVIVGPLGANMTNIVFAAPGARVVTLVPSDYPDTFFWFISLHRQHDYSEVRAKQLDPKDWNGGFVLTAEDIAFLAAL